MTIDIDLKATLRVGLSVAMLTAGIGAQAFEVDRTHLPIAEPDPPKFKELDVRNVETPPLFSVKAPEGAPNVIIVLIDDVGFGATTAFGGPINTPTMDRLAAGGLAQEARSRRHPPVAEEHRSHRAEVVADSKDGSEPFDAAPAADATLQLQHRVSSGFNPPRAGWLV